MGMFTNIYIDANLDIRELALHLLPELTASQEVHLQHPLPGDLQYHFLAEGNRPMVYLSENREFYLYTFDTSSYRYQLSAIRGPQIPYMQAAYERLLQHGCFPLAYQTFEGLTDFTFQPPNHTPDYSIITRQMPIELLIHTDMKEPKLRRKLKQWTNQNFSGDVFYGNFSTSKVGGYLQKIRKDERQDLTSRYSGTTASHYIRIFGCDDHPPLRRERRNAFARATITALQEKTEISIEAFEVIASKFVPFR